MKSDLKLQYDEQIVSHRRPKGSRNVLNSQVVLPNPNNALMPKPRAPSSDESSSSESSEEGRGDIDHTYNPYSFKKLEKAIFAHKKTLARVAEDEEEVKIVVEAVGARPGKTDWTMDLPKINYDYDDEEEEDEEEDDDSLIKVEDIALSDDESDEVKGKKNEQGSSSDDEEDLEASSIAKVERKYLMMK